MIKNKSISTSHYENCKDSSLFQHHVYYELEPNYLPWENISQFTVEIHERIQSNVGRIILYKTFSITSLI